MFRAPSAARSGLDAALHGGTGGEEEAVASERGAATARPHRVLARGLGARQRHRHRRAHQAIHEIRSQAGEF